MVQDVLGAATTPRINTTGAPAGYTQAPTLMEVIQGIGVMMRGQAGPGIKDLQAALNAAGANPPLAEDGLFGPKTDAALRKFQEQAGLSPDGRFARQTLLNMQTHQAFDPAGSWDPRKLASTTGRNPSNVAPHVEDPAPTGGVRAGDLARAGEWNRYTIAAEADPAARTLSGQLRLEYTNRDSAALDRLYFHLYPNLPDFGGRLDVQNIAVDGVPAEVVYETRRYLLRVNLPQPLAPNATTVIELTWKTTTPQNAGDRLYGAFNSEAGLMTLASAYPIAAVVRGGQWDIGWPDPKGDFVNSETALYDVTLRVPGGWQAVSTGVVTDRQEDAGSTQTLRIVSGPQRDFTLALAQFEVASAEVEGTRINSYFRAANAAGGQGALDAASKALSAFNKRYGPYPLRELDVIEIPANTFLGVEYPGMIMIAEGLYGGGSDLELTVAHEVGHQWWYSQVGNDVQMSSWLDEALASYSQIVYQEEYYGAAAAERELNGFRERYQRALASGRDAPAQQANSQFRNNYVLLVYGKAVLFFQALRQQIGDDAFDHFLHDYYATNRYRYVTGADLVGSANQACSCDIQPLYDDWITRAVPLTVP